MGTGWDYCWRSVEEPSLVTKALNSRRTSTNNCTWSDCTAEARLFVFTYAEEESLGWLIFQFTSACQSCQIQTKHQSRATNVIYTAKIKCFGALV